MTSENGEPIVAATVTVITDEPALFLKALLGNLPDRPGKLVEGRYVQEFHTLDAPDRRRRSPSGTS